MNEEQIRELSIKYLNGTATPEERQVLLSWYRQTDQEITWASEDGTELDKVHDRVLINLQHHIRSNKKQSKNSAVRWVAAASVLLLCTLAFIERDQIRQLFSPVQQLFANTKYGERKIITLTDGTKIWLAAGSRLQYPSAFDGHTRDVSFSGEAFFEVAKDKAHPFIIHTGNITTKVLGTSFDLSAYKEQKQITVTLLTGKVAFSDGRKSVFILPNQQAIYQKEKGTITSENYPDAQQMLARRDGNYEYNNLPVAEIIEDLKKNYNLDITVDGPIDQCLFYGRIRQDEDPEKFLRKLCLVMNATLKKEGNAFRIMGGGCP